MAFIFYYQSILILFLSQNCQQYFNLVIQTSQCIKDIFPNCFFL